MIRSRQAEVSQLDSVTMVGDQDVLRLQVPMVDSELVAVIDGIEDLKEDLLGELVIADILSTLCDVEEQVTFRAELENDEYTIDIVYNLVHGHHIAVGRCQIVKTNLSLLVSNLAPLQRGSVCVVLAEALDGVSNSSGDVEGRVDDTVGTSTQDARQLKLALQEGAESLFRRQRDISILFGG